MSIFKRTQRKYVKKAYRVRNWREYEAGLRNRGSLTVWISLTAGKLVNWDAPPAAMLPRTANGAARGSPSLSTFLASHIRVTRQGMGNSWCFRNQVLVAAA